MRTQFLLLALCVCIPAALATDYAVYSPDGSIAITGGPTWNVSIAIPSHDTFDTAANALAHAQTGGASAETIAALTNVTLDELARAKAADSVYIQGVNRSVLLRYKQCDTLDGYRVCFKSSTYLEEDGPPLGDTILNTVKVVNGSVLIPVTLSVDSAVGKLSAARTFSITTPYPGQEVTVTERVTNTGTAPVDSVRITDSSPFTPVQGAVTAFSGVLGENENLAVVYTIKPTVPGVYPFHTSFQPSSISLPDVNLTVRDPLLLSANVATGRVGVPQPITISLANDYSGDVIVTSSHITSPASITLDNVSLDRTDPHSLGLHSFTIHSGMNYTINGSIVADAPTNGTIALTATYGGTVEGTEDAQIPYVALAQGIDVAPQASAGALQVTLTSTATDRVDAILLEWGDGTNDTVGFLVAGRAITLTHAYAPTAASPVSLRLSYTLRAVPETHTYSYVVPGLNMHPITPGTIAPPLANGAVLPPQANATVNATKSGTPSPAPPVHAPAPTSDSWFVRAWDWIIGRFR